MKQRINSRLYWDCYTSNTARRNASWATSDRGWLFADGAESSLGNYLDYGPNHYRSGHEYCRDGKCQCRQSQPGNVHAISYASRESRYFETVEQAKAWLLSKAQS